MTGARSKNRTFALQAAVLAAAALLVVLTWAFTFTSINTEQDQARARAEGSVSNLALAVEWQLTRQMQGIDQTLQILASEWKNDPAHFDVLAWKRRSPLLGDLSLQILLLDAQGFVMASTKPEMLGFDYSERDYYLAQKSSRRTGLFVGPAIRWKSTGRWEINLSRRLEMEDGSFAGAIVVSYDPWQLINALEQVDIGARGLIALVGSDGALRALVSPYEVRPGEDIGSTAMFHEAIARQQGTWIGPSAPDEVQRVHAFRRLRGQDLLIVVGMDYEEAMRTAVKWAANAQLFASGISVAVLLMALLLLREISAGRLRETRLAQDRAVLEAAYAELAAAKASIEAKSAQMEATLSGMTDGVMMLDSELRLVQWNDRFALYCGLPREMLKVGLPMEEMLRAQALAGEFGQVDAETEVRWRMTRLRTLRSVGVLERTRPNGRTLELRRSALPGGGFVTLYSDITARKQTEEAQALARRLAEEATEQKSRFVAIVSHEIRTPLNAVLTSLTLLNESGLSPAQQRLAETAQQAGDALLELINDILELSKMEAGKLALRPSAFALRPVLEGVRDMFRSQAEERGIQLGLEVAADMPERLCGDSGRIRQVLMNFVSNAVKFSAPGVATIRAARVTLAGRFCLLLAVRDPGPRIPEHEAARLFQPFSRLDNAREIGAPGTGLGLAICERLTRLMGGQLGVGPGADGGNEFWLTLPFDEATAPRAEAPPPPARTRRANVLLVEDIPANHLVTATLLRREGHRVDIAESGPEAIRMVQERSYDLVFMDLIMPGMNGYEAARRIRALPGEVGRVPIVALTANTAPEDRARCIGAGMNDMLGKPVRPSELFEMVLRTNWNTALQQPEVGGVSAAEPAAPLDEARLKELHQGLSAATMDSLVEQCLTDIRQRLPALRGALVAGDAETIEQLAHALAGMAGTYGLVAVERRMRGMMDAVRRGDVAAAVAASSGMDAEFARASEAIRAMLRAHAV